MSEKHGHGYFTIPTKDHPGGLLVDPKITGTGETKVGRGHSM